MVESVLEVEDLHTSFFTTSGVVKAVRGVSLSLQKGRMIGVVGESGAGKTTLASSIMGAVRPPGRVVQGRTLLFGKDLQTMSESELRAVRGREIAMIVPNPRAELNPVIPVGKQLAAVARANLKVSKRDAVELALAKLAEVKIPDPKRRAQAYPHELSGGMAQRVVIAMALISGPGVIISDDATSGLDVTVQAQVLDLTVRLLRDDGVASIMITRDLGIVANYCDSVVVLYQGKIVESAPLRAFFGNPRHPYSSDLLSAFSYADSATMAAHALSYDSDELELVEVEPDHFVREVR